MDKAREKKAIKQASRLENYLAKTQVLKAAAVQAYEENVLNFLLAIILFCASIIMITVGTAVIVRMV